MPQILRNSNLDIATTIIDLLGSLETNRLITENLSGSSLFSTISNKRIITCLSTNDFRKSTNNGFGLYKDSLSYIVDKLNNKQLYDLNNDPEQNSDILSAFSVDSLKIFYDKIISNEYLRKINKEAVAD